MALHSDAELSRVPPGKLYPKPEPELTAPVVHAPESQPELDSPNNPAAEQQPDIGAPNILTPIAPVAFPANCGRIGYANLLTSYATSNNTAQAGALLTPSTWERWQSLSSGTVTVTGQLTIASAVSFAAINGDIGGAEVIVSTSPDLSAAFTEQARLTVPVDQVSAMLSFSDVTAMRVQFTIIRSTAVNVAVAWAGPVLILQRPTRGGVSPANLSRSTSYSNEFSAAGNILGRVINRQGLTTKVDLRNLTDDWYRSSFDPFVQAARTTPFFYLWNPRDYPLDCIYGVCSDDIKPTLQGGREMMEVSFDIEGL